MDKYQLRRLLAVVFGLAAYIFMSLYVHSWHIIKESEIICWVISFLIPVCVIGGGIIIVATIWGTIERIYNFIKDGD